MSNLSTLFLASASATYKDLSTGRCRVDFNPPLSFPPNTRLKLCCQSFQFTNFFINISSTIGNNTFYYSDDLGNLVKYTITIPDGSYNVSELSEAVNLGVIANGHTSNLITIIPDFSSNKVIFNISAAGWILNFPAGTPYVLLGCTLNQTIPNGALTVGAYSEMAPNVATFNSIQSIYLHTSLTNNSNFSGQKSDVISAVVPTVSIGSIQQSRDYWPLWIDCSNLAGQSLSSIHLSLTDQNGNTILMSDDFSCVIVIDNE